MNFINSFLKKDSKPPSSSPQSNQSYIIRPKGKELNINTIEEKKVKYIKKPLTYEFTFKVHGKSIFQNLILTASASSNGETIPIKCQWKRINNETIIFIKDINGYSYMPSAEDIGYTIEIEVVPLDGDSDEVAVAKYGPIEMDKDMKSAVELLLTSGNTNFSVGVFDEIEQDRVPNKDLNVSLTSDELKLISYDVNGNAEILEKCKYSSLNPQIKLNSNDTTRFSIKFFDVSPDEINMDDMNAYNNLKVKKEYSLIAMSKQCRELIYLLVQFFIIDERMKNNKIFSLVNYNAMPTETKIGVTDLIGELKKLKEENVILMKNMKYLEFVNKKLNSDMKNLEEDFQITLEKINGADLHVSEDIRQNEKNNKTNNGSSLIKGSVAEWKQKYEDATNMLNAMKAKEKAMREEKKEFLLNSEINKNLIEKSKSEIKSLKEQISKSESDFAIMSKNYKLVKEENDKIKEEFEKLKISNVEMKETIAKMTSKNDNNEEINKQKAEIETLKKQIEKNEYENKNLILQRNLLSNQKNDIVKEFEKSKKENSSLTSKLNDIITEKEKNEIFIKETKEQYEKVKKEYNDIHNAFDLLKIDHKVLQDNYDKLIEGNNLNNTQMSMSIKISPDEYEEYDQLRKEKDEFEATIMQLKSNNEAKDVEIQNLKMIIDSYKKE